MWSPTKGPGIELWVTEKFRRCGPTGQALFCQHGQEMKPGNHFAPLAATPGVGSEFRSTGDPRSGRIPAVCALSVAQVADPWEWHSSGLA